jgi:hypothetical protein
MQGRTHEKNGSKVLVLIQKQVRGSN